MSSCRVLLIASSLLAVCLPAFAGHYSGPVYDASGGTATVYGQYTITSSGISGEGQGPTSGSCSGTLKATFTWVTDYENEPPPKSVIVTRTASATASTGASPDTTPSATCATGLGQSATGAVFTFYSYPPYGPPIATNKSAYATVSETKHEVMTGSNSLVVECGPSASAGGNRGAVTNVSFSASVEPVYIEHGGTTADADHNLHALIGQGVSATMKAGTFTLAEYQWTVPGEKFDAFVRGSGDSTGVVTPFTEDRLKTANPKWYWLTGGTLPVTVKCTAKVIVNGASIGPADAEIKVKIHAPTFTSSGLMGLEADISHYDGELRLHAGVRNPGVYKDGMRITGSMYVPDIFTGASKWTYVQVIDLQRFRYRMNGSDVETHAGTTNGKYMGEFSLDNAFPYPFNQNTASDGTWSPDIIGSSAPTSFRISGDSPYTRLDNPYFRYSVNSESFEMHQMFLPPGDGQWVPISKFDWSWSADVQRTGSSWNDTDFTPTPPGSTSASGTGARNTKHPKWYRKISNSQIGYD